jgi:hypothetical protein
MKVTRKQLRKLINESLKDLAEAAIKSKPFGLSKGSTIEVQNVGSCPDDCLVMDIERSNGTDHVWLSNSTRWLKPFKLFPDKLYAIRVSGPLWEPDPANPESRQRSDEISHEIQYSNGKFQAAGPWPMTSDPRDDSSLFVVGRLVSDEPIEFISPVNLTLKFEELAYWSSLL